MSQRILSGPVLKTVLLNISYYLDPLSLKLRSCGQCGQWGRVNWSVGSRY
jgi:hypothetical protein